MASLRTFGVLLVLSFCRGQYGMRSSPNTTTETDSEETVETFETVETTETVSFSESFTQTLTWEEKQVIEVISTEVTKKLCPNGPCPKPGKGEGILTEKRLFEGDVLGVPRNATQDSSTDAKKQLESEVRDDTLWPDATVPFEIDNWIRAKPEQMKTIMVAMEVFHNNTCNSYPGRQNGSQAVRLQAPDCFTPGLISHELMHSLGCYHEQARSDRDKYVEINFDNIIKGDEDQFKNYLRTRSMKFGLPYDFESITHYGETDFAIDKNSWTIRPKPQYYAANIAKMGQRIKLSEGDIKKINLMYKCPPSTTATTTTTTTTTTAAPKGPCGTSPGWLSYDTWCYYFSFLADESAVQYFPARDKCKAIRAALVSPTQKQLKEFIVPTITGNGDKIAKTDLIWMDGVRLITGVDQQAHLDRMPKKTQLAQFICKKRAASAAAA